MTDQKISNQTEWSKNYDKNNKAELYPLKLYKSKKKKKKAWRRIRDSNPSDGNPP